MEYNVDKCEVIHFGRNNSKMDYCAEGPGVFVVRLQVQQVIKKANGILSFIARGMEFKNSLTFWSTM